MLKSILVELKLGIIKCLVYVDDIITVNTNPEDVYQSHSRVTWFSQKKRLALNGPKCLVLGVNLKPSDVIPRLLVDGTILELKKTAVYLGDVFNSRGTNADLILDRVQRGKACIVSAMALCSDVTLGLHAVETLLMLYRSLFVQVVLFNAQAWSNMSKTDINRLQTVQLKFLKRIFHAPPSTSNPLTFLETGILPIQYEIQLRQPSYLHHILTLEDDDPVKQSYQQQLLYPMAPNWANEVMNMRKMYNIIESDSVVANLSKDRWKHIIKDKVNAIAMDNLNLEIKDQKHAHNLPPFTELTKQQYMEDLPPKLCRKVFHVRTGTVDLRGVREYMYGDNNMCRLCGAETESVEHVVNLCPEITRTTQIEHIFTTNCKELREVAERCLEFDQKIDDQSNVSEN